MGWRWTERLEDVPPDAWNDVLCRSSRPSPFLSPVFLVPWAKTFAADAPRRIGIWERAGRTEGLLFLYRPAAGEGWELLGGVEVADDLDAVVASGREREFWSGFLGSARGLLEEGPISLQNVVAGSPLLGVLPPLCAERGVRLSLDETDRSPYVPLPATFDGYLASLDGKARHELRRKIRRAGEALPGLSFRTAGTREDLARDFPTFVALHRKSHPEKNEFMDDRMEGFFREVAEGFLSAGRLRLAFLSCASGDVASAFQIEREGALLLYNSGFDPRYRAAVPGIVLLARCIEEAIAGGVREYDFLRGKERYKYDLGARDRAVYRVTLRSP